MGCSFAGLPLIDPGAFFRASIDTQTPVEQWHGKANVYACPTGEAHGYGAVLLRGDAVARLQPGQAGPLTMDDGRAAVVISRVFYQSAKCVSPGRDGDPAGVFLVSLVDDRYNLAKVSMSAVYNLATDDGTAFVPTSLNGGAPWTWAAMVADLWNRCGGLGPFPGVPAVPDGTPVNFDFRNGKAWKALNAVMSRLGWVVKYDPLANLYTIVRMGDPDPAAKAAAAKLKPRETWNTYEPANAALRPSAVRVLFRRYPQAAPGVAPYVEYLLAIPAATRGRSAGGSVTLYDDLIALGPDAPTNGAALAARAAIRLADWIRVWTLHDRRTLRDYSGARAEVATMTGRTAYICSWEDRGVGLRSCVASGPTGKLEGWQDGGTDGVPQAYAVCTAFDRATHKGVGNLVAFDPATDTWSTAGPGTTLYVHGGTLSVGSRYPAKTLADGTILCTGDANRVGANYWAGFVGTDDQIFKGTKRFRNASYWNAEPPPTVPEPPSSSGLAYAFVEPQNGTTVRAGWYGAEAVSGDHPGFVGVTAGPGAGNLTTANGNMGTYSGVVWAAGGLKQARHYVTGQGVSDGSAITNFNAGALIEPTFSALLVKDADGTSDGAMAGFWYPAAGGLFVNCLNNLCVGGYGPRTTAAGVPPSPAAEAAYVERAYAVFRRADPTAGSPHGSDGPEIGIDADIVIPLSASSSVKIRVRGGIVTGYTGVPVPGAGGGA